MQHKGKRRQTSGQRNKQYSIKKYSRKFFIFRERDDHSDSGGI